MIEKRFKMFLKGVRYEVCYCWYWSSADTRGFYVVDVFREGIWLDSFRVFNSFESDSNLRCEFRRIVRNRIKAGIV